MLEAELVHHPSEFRLAARREQPEHSIFCRNALSERRKVDVPTDDAAMLRIGRDRADVCYIDRCMHGQSRPANLPSDGADPRFGLAQAEGAAHRLAETDACRAVLHARGLGLQRYAFSPCRAQIAFGVGVTAVDK